MTHSHLWVLHSSSCPCFFFTDGAFMLLYTCSTLTGRNNAAEFHSLAQTCCSGDSCWAKTLSDIPLPQMGGVINGWTASAQLYVDYTTPASPPGPRKNKWIKNKIKLTHAERLKGTVAEISDDDSLRRLNGKGWMRIMQKKVRVCS